jgi:hypothetical protein
VVHAPSHDSLAADMVYNLDTLFPEAGDFYWHKLVEPYSPRRKNHMTAEVVVKVVNIDVQCRS